MKAERFTKLPKIVDVMPFRTVAISGVALWALCAVSLPASAEVNVTIHDGLVTVVARDATVRQILTEWARVGQTKVVNGERIPGGPISLELTNVPEEQALDLLLRSISGYIAAPRRIAAANLSRYDRVIVMPTSAPPRPPLTPVPPPPSPPLQQFQQPQPIAQPVVQPGAPGAPGVPAIPEDDAEEERQQPAPNPARAPVFQTYPQPQVVNPSQPLPTGAAPFQPPPGQRQQQPPSGPPPAAFPTAPYGGVAVPGMVAPAPQQPPNQPGVMPVPGQPASPPAPRRPGGGR
jgi:hypothetical protein